MNPLPPRTDSLLQRIERAVGDLVAPHRRIAQLTRSAAVAGPDGALSAWVPQIRS